MVKIAYFQNECAPYRIPVFEGVNMLPNVELKVYFGRYRSSSRNWIVDIKCNFNYEILRDLRFFSPLFYFNFVDDGNPLNPSLLFRLLSDNYDIFVGGVPHYFGTIITFIASKIRRKPFVLFLEDIDISGRDTASYLGYLKTHPFNVFNYPLIFLRFIMGLFILRNSSCYIVPGTATKEYVQRRGILPSKIFTAWNVIDNVAVEKACNESNSKGNAQKLRERLCIKNKKIVLSVAYLREKKGLQYLILACAKLKKEGEDIALVIVGDGPYKKELEDLARKNSISPIFTGYVSNLSDLVDYYLASDVFVLPTLDDVWGFVINEAMVCGCPIVATQDSGAARDLVKTGVNGYIVKTGSAKHLYLAIKKILQDKELRADMQQASKDIIQNFNLETSLLGYTKAIEYVLKGKS